MIGTLYESIFQELLKNKAIEVVAVEINKDSMRTQFIRWRGKLLTDKILNFERVPENPTRLIITLADKQPKRKIEFKILEPTHDPSSISANLGANQEG